MKIDLLIDHVSLGTETIVEQDEPETENETKDEDENHV